MSETETYLHYHYQAENTAMVAADAAEGSSAAGDGESPEELAKWTEGLGEKGNSAATKMQARQRAKQVWFHFLHQQFANMHGSVV